MGDRAYYVVYKNDQWKVKLERGRVVSSNHRKQSAAIREARKLGRRNDRKVVVNTKQGYTRRHIKNP